ncbi:MAG: hypothetical protein ACEPOV_06110 [Hyphomicrobiales bacterium]
MKKTSYLSVALIIITMVVVQACSPTTLTQIWKSPDYKGSAFKEVAIIAVFPSQGFSNRFEEIVSQELEKAGVKNEIGYKILGEKRKMKKQRMANMIAKSGADAVLVFKFRGVNKRKTFYPGNVSVFPDFYYSYYNYWFYTYDVVRTPGYVQTDRWVRVESNLYDAKPDKLIWTAESETINPDGVENLAINIAKAVIHKLAMENLIQVDPSYLEKHK